MRTKGYSIAENAKNANDAHCHGPGDRDAHLRCLILGVLRAQTKDNDPGHEWMEEGVSQYVPYQVDGEVLVPWRVFFLSLLLFRGLEGDGLYGGWHCGCFDAGGLSMLKHDVST